MRKLKEKAYHALLFVTQDTVWQVHFGQVTITEHRNGYPMREIAEAHFALIRKRLSHPAIRPWHYQ